MVLQNERQVLKMKEFVGTMRVTPKLAKCEPYAKSGRWVYSEEEKCWFNGTTPYAEDIVEIINVDREVIHKVNRV